jgi:type II secretory pathway pseudopilin PulG
MRNESGFTLVEMMVVVSITILMTSLMLQNFSRSRVDLDQMSLNVLGAVREAQTDVQSGSTYTGNYRCGFGITFTATGYTIFAGPNADDPATVCSATDRSNDTIVRQASLANTALELASGDSPAALKTIFFEPPNPTTYINGSSADGLQTLIYIRRIGATCPSVDCRTVIVTTAGRIQLQ